MPDGIKRVFATQLTESSTSAKEELGTIRREGAKTYKYVQYDPDEATVDAAIGGVVSYEEYALSRVTCDHSDSEASIGAGVMLFAVDASDSSAPRYGWIQIKGIYSGLAQDVTAGAVGNAMTIVGASDAELDVSALVTDAIVAYLVDDTTTAQVILCAFPF